jgi:predicted DNA-binding antitoxin AbrB/MazE fold protein
MNLRVDAIYEDGVFRPEVPVNIANGQRVSLDVDTEPASANGLSDVADLLDQDFMESCRQSSGPATSLAEVREVLGAFPGSLADWISSERDER